MAWNWFEVLIQFDPAELPNWVRKESKIISPDCDRLSNIFLSLEDKKLFQ